MCEDVDECNSIAKSHNCSTYADCNNLGRGNYFHQTIPTQFVNSSKEGSWVCDCRAGFTGTGETCEDVDECKIDKECNQTDQCGHRCDLETEDCENKFGTYKCPCRTGFNRTGGNTTCEDVDECTEKYHDCNTVAELCQNTVGRRVSRDKKSYFFVTK